MKEIIKQWATTGSINASSIPQIAETYIRLMYNDTISPNIISILMGTGAYQAGDWDLALYRIAVKEKINLITLVAPTGHIIKRYIDESTC